ncbi:cob(I)yrinic acid a,c-diamide adenosyltransferase [candidate division WWE3 bacterium]|uniref:Corrinoid adenosyltransferase n=1 Tax=candidate division WWE3 bacterium TaxID=2053526 RepID=A0A7X9E6X5_UNCKA|nr:cob(I)yrinic acid a,c-diamide adenosyltransferase [candidate division WWE3 bacterium]
MFKVYTKQGDNGFTLLPKISKKISKSDLVFEVLGTFDELGVCLGFLHTARLNDVKKVSIEVQKDLLSLGSLIISQGKISDATRKNWEKRVKELEEVIDYFQAKTDSIQSFILPGGCRESAFLHLSRVTCRRLERLVVRYIKKKKDMVFVVKYLNRLSDLLFVMARYVNKKLGFKDLIWENKA